MAWRRTATPSQAHPTLGEGRLEERQEQRLGGGVQRMGRTKGKRTEEEGKNEGGRNSRRGRG